MNRDQWECKHQHHEYYLPIASIGDEENIHMDCQADGKVLMRALHSQLVEHADECPSIWTSVPNSSAKQ